MNGVPHSFLFYYLPNTDRVPSESFLVKEKDLPSLTSGSGGERTRF